jgi:exodeoxyribonuclease VII large subunit
MTRKAGEEAGRPDPGRQEAQLSFLTGLRPEPPPKLDPTSAPAPGSPRPSQERPPSPGPAPAIDGSPLPSLEPTSPPRPAEPAAPRIFSVTEILRAARVTLESRFTDVRVEGEVSGLKRSGPGHLYFCLKDEEAQLDCVLFSREAARLRFALEEGMAVRCRGRLTLYEARGRFQMSVVEIEPTGAGALALAFEQLKQRLGAEGLFDPARKRPLPFLPRRLGVVTSPQGAVFRDIIRVAQRRCPLPILLSPAPVQGEGAALAIAGALRRLEAISDVDVIILARGGGSLEDLWAFNEEPVARAIFACRVPVISAVGHETDFTIADFVADLRAPTPSAAAELAVPVREELAATLTLLQRRGGRALAESLRAARHALERARGRLGDPRRLLDERRQRLDEPIERGRRALGRRFAAARAELRATETRLYHFHPQRRILEQRGELAGMRHRLETSIRPALEQRGELAALRHRLETSIRPALVRRRHAVDAARGKLDALSPMRVLERGFSLTQRADGHLIKSAGEVAPGDSVQVRLRDGAFAATVVEKKGS